MPAFNRRRGPQARGYPSVQHEDGRLGRLVGRHGWTPAVPSESILQKGHERVDEEVWCCVDSFVPSEAPFEFVFPLLPNAPCLSRGAQGR